VKARQQIETLAGNGQRRAFTPAVILFIALPEGEGKTPPEVTEIPLTLLPRRCPFCGNRTIIGHGRRLKQAHDEGQKQIWIRRGLCRPCRKTFTVLPDWSPPSGPYSLHCRQKAWELLRQSDSNWERSVPDIADASRSPDPSTVRRWAERLLLLGTLLTAKLWQATGCRASTPPTILAWDWTAICRILPIEARSP
jgi:hypothetical protein